jgi:hypothetical protein
LRGIGVRQVPLAAAFNVHLHLSHFFNHALGNISYDDGMGCDFMFRGGDFRPSITRSTLPPSHFSFGLWAFINGAIVATRL